MAAKSRSDLSAEDREKLLAIGKTLAREGVKEKEPSLDGASSTPAHEKQGWSERGRVRDLQSEKEGRPEVIASTRTTWVERLEASRGGKPQGGGPAERAAERRPENDRAEPASPATRVRESAEGQASPAAGQETAEPSASPRSFTERLQSREGQQGAKRRGRESSVEGRKEPTHEAGAASSSKPQDRGSRSQGHDREHER